MNREEVARRRAAAADEFNRHESRTDGRTVVDLLDEGLTLLANTLYIRLHEDVESMIGADSMLMPVSPAKTRVQTLAEIDLFQIAESASLVQQSGHVGDAGRWYVPWLSRLRLGDAPPAGGEQNRISAYLAQTAQYRRLSFTDVLARVVPESRRAPLVLFQIFPLAVQLVTAQAFGDSAAVTELRHQQAERLPSMADCRYCNGRVLGKGEQCPRCGNPLWNAQWLTAAD